MKKVYSSAFRLNWSWIIQVVVLVVFAFHFWGCRPDQEEEVKPKSDEFVTCRVDGKTITDDSPLVFYSDDSGTYRLALMSVLTINETEGYTLSLGIEEPKVGQFTGQTLSGEVSYIAGTILSPVIRDYELTDTPQNTVTFTQFDPQGYAEGEFTLTAKDSNGKTVSLTNGKFRVKI